ncbi:MAG: acyltransferase family protein [Saprospiraceae bacterium]|nr:acyltransferase family protein [Saprospiraceae bacterium]MDW8228572.1 acyltransferase family protein [Saprospiraceae bacterium]
MNNRDSSAQTEREQASASVSSPNKRLYISYIRAIAAFAVVQMHAVGGYLYWYGKEAAHLHPQFMAADVYYSFLRWATPFFIMISGSLLLDNPREQPLGTFLGKRLRRVLIPFAFWGGIYLLYYFRSALYSGQLPQWREVAHKIFYEDIYFHLWFLPMIAGLYLLTPVLKIWVKAATRRNVEYFMGLIFLFNTLHQYLPGFFLVKHFAWFGYVGYYLLGYYLSVYPISLQWKRWLYPAAWVMPFLSAGIVWWMSVQKGDYDEAAFVYSSPNILLMTGAWFVFLRDYDWEGFAYQYPRLHRWAMYLAEVSFGVYLIHPLLLDILKNGYLGISINPHALLDIPVPFALGGLLTGIIATALSVALISLLRRFALVREWLT